MSKFFQSDIFNNGLVYKNIPVYSLLSDDKKFSIDNVEDWKKDHSLNNLFVLCGGQQTLPFPNDKSSLVYGKKFTGTNLYGYRKYHIDREGNFASSIFEKYGKDSLVLDILDPQFVWGKGMLTTSISINFIFDVITRILDGNSATRIILVGFSRGATFALMLAKWLRGITNEKIVYSIDPVSSGLRKEVRNICLEHDEHWEVIDKGFSLSLKIKSFFPVIENPGCKVWNVFQRNSLLASLDFNEYPIGSAVLDAHTLINPEFPEVRSLVSQYDRTCTKHQTMPILYLPKVWEGIETLIGSGE